MCNPIPSFDSNGNLPPGVYIVRLEHIKEKLTWSTKRQQLFNGLEKAVKNLNDAGVWQIYIDGSFTTNEDNPNDIDGCWVPNRKVDTNIIDAVFIDDRTHPSTKMKAKYGVDFKIAGVDYGKAGSQPIVEYFQTNNNCDAKGILLIES